MFKSLTIACLLQALLIIANDDKATTKTGQQPDAQENAYITIESKKSKHYEIYTPDGKYVSEGILDFNSRVNVSHLKPGDYLVVIGKKAYQFTIN